MLERYGMNPVDIAKPFAEELVMTRRLDLFEHSDFEVSTLTTLDGLAAEQDMLDRSYHVDAGRSVLLPRRLMDGQSTNAFHFQHLRFRGELRSYGTVRLKSIMGVSAMNALCLMFDEVHPMPGTDDFGQDILYVPVFAVFDIEQIAA